MALIIKQLKIQPIRNFSLSSTGIMSSFLFDVFQMYEDAFAFHVPKSITKEKNRARC